MSTQRTSSAVSTTVVRFEPRGAAIDMLRSKADIVMMSGAAGTGKSVPCMMKLHLACLSVPRTRCLVVRKTLTSLTASTLVSFREKVAKEAIDAGLVRWYGGSSAEPAAYRYTNGSVIVVGGLDRPTRLLSTEYDLCFLDEAIEATADDIDTILSRLRNGRLPFQQLVMATNPAAPSHPLKRRADGGGIHLLYSRHEDNPRNLQGGAWTPEGASYLARLDKLTGARYHRLRWGKWVSAEGVIYTGFEPSVHLVNRFDVPDDWVRWWVVDFGFTNPFVWQEWVQDGDGRLYHMREIYRTQTLVEDHARKILEIVAPDGTWITPRPRAIICDHDAEDRATLERHLGMRTVAAHKTVSDGIQATQGRFKAAGDGKPRIFFVRDALVERDQELVDAGKPASTLEEIDGYIWEPSPDGKPSKDRPLKIDDHGMDAMRYLVAANDLKSGFDSFMAAALAESPEERAREVRERLREKEQAKAPTGIDGFMSQLGAR